MAILSQDSQDDLVTDINMTPLIDVMLVLLIIFIVTLPAMSHALKVDLPKAASATAPTKAQDVDVSIRADGAIAWNKEPVDDGTLQAKLAAAAAQQPEPALRIFVDQHVEYGKVAHLLSFAQGAGLTKLDFVTEPSGGN